MPTPEPIITKKRFIAGAVCPECQATDRIVVETAVVKDEEPELSRRRCVACGFADEFNPVAGGLSQTVPKGRPERPKISPSPATAVKILDPQTISSKSPDKL